MAERRNKIRSKIFTDPEGRVYELSGFNMMEGAAGPRGRYTYRLGEGHVIRGDFSVCEISAKFQSRNGLDDRSIVSAYRDSLSYSPQIIDLTWKSDTDVQELPYFSPTGYPVVMSTPKQLFRLVSTTGKALRAKGFDVTPADVLNTLYGELRVSLAKRGDPLHGKSFRPVDANKWVDAVADALEARRLPVACYVRVGDPPKGVAEPITWEEACNPIQVLSRVFSLPVYKVGPSVGFSLLSNRLSQVSAKWKRGEIPAGFALNDERSKGRNPWAAQELDDIMSILDMADPDTGDSFFSRSLRTVAAMRQVGDEVETEYFERPSGDIFRCYWKWLTWFGAVSRDDFPVWVPVHCMGPRKPERDFEALCNYLQDELSPILDLEKHRRYLRARMAAGRKIEAWRWKKKIRKVVARKAPRKVRQRNWR